MQLPAMGKSDEVDPMQIWLFAPVMSDEYFSSDEVGPMSLPAIGKSDEVDPMQVSQ